MKKIQILFLFAFLSAQFANGQVLISILLGDKLNTDKLEFGLNLGSTWSTLDGIDDVKYLRTFSLGLYFNIKLADNLYLHPAVFPKFTYGAQDLPVYLTGNPEIDNLYGEGSAVQRRIGSIPVPILLRYQTNSAWGIEAGPQLTLRTKARDIFKRDFEDLGELEFELDNKDIYKRITFETAFGIYKKLKKGEGMTLNFRYVLGISDILKDNPGEAQKHGAFQFLVGVPIGKDKTQAEEIE